MMYTKGKKGKKKGIHKKKRRIEAHDKSMTYLYNVAVTILMSSSPLTIKLCLIAVRSQQSSEAGPKTAVGLFVAGPEDCSLHFYTITPTGPVITPTQPTCSHNGQRACLLLNGSNLSVDRTDLNLPPTSNCKVNGWNNAAMKCMFLTLLIGWRRRENWPRRTIMIRCISPV